MDKQNLIYVYNAISFGNKKEWSIGSCYNLDGSLNITLNLKIMQIGPDILWFHLYKMSRIGIKVD